MVIGWKAQQILHIPIVLGLVGLCWGIFNMTYDPVVKWERSKKTIGFIIGGSVGIFLSQISLIVEEFVLNGAFFYIFIILQILACFAIALGFYFFYKDLVSLFIQKLMPRNPLPLLSIAYFLQGLAYSFFTVSVFTIEFVTSEVIDTVFLIIGFVFFGLFLAVLAVGTYLLFPAFRAFPALGDYLEEQINKKGSRKKKADPKRKQVTEIRSK
jgi:hypothetical protein